MTEGLFCIFFTEERMDMKNNITAQIESGYGDLRKSEKQAADYILDHMEEAAETGGAGKRQEPDLMYGYTLDRKEGLDAVPLNITVTTERMMEETLKNLPLKTYRKVIDALRGARLIDIYSVENSEVAAMDLMTKLLYLGLPCRHFPDSYLQQITAAGLTEADVAVGISYSGESRDTVDALKAAKRAGACTIAVTNFGGSTICRYADILICTSQDQHLISSDYEHYVNQLNKCENVVRRKAYENN